MNIQDIKFDDIVEWVKINGLSEQLIDRLNEATEEFNRSLSREDRYKNLLSDIKELSNLYDTNKDFNNWCQWLKKIVLYDEYMQTCEEKYDDIEWYDNEEDYYIPCLTGKWLSANCNPYFFLELNHKIIYLKKDFDSLVMNSEAFSCFWKHRVNTRLIPTFDIYDDNEDTTYEQLDSDKYEKYYKRRLQYKEYSNSEIDKLWNDANGL